MVRRRKTTDEEIIAAYREIGSGIAVARKLHLAEMTVYSVLKAHGVVTDGLALYRKRARKLDEGKLASIKAEYESGTPALQLAKKYGVSNSVLLVHLRRVGAEIRSKMPMTEEEKQTAKGLYEQGLNFYQVAEKTGRSAAALIAMMHREYPDLVRSGTIGPGGPHWKGGRNNHRGYVMVWLSPEDPFYSMAHKSGYVAEHRLNLARKLGRPLLVSETVHHIDGDRSNNSPANLQLRHGRHGKGVAPVCLDCGSHNIGTRKLE